MKKDDGEGFWGHLWREALMAISLGWELAIPIFGGVLLGHLLDRRWGTGHIFTMGLLALGVGIGYYNLGRFIQRVHRRDQQQTDREEEMHDDDR